MSDDIVIKVENLTKVYKLYSTPLDRLKESLSPFRRKYHRDFHALHDVSFEVKKGETIGIIGKNGSGKSTLLKIITGVLTPTSGSVVINGRISALLELGAGFNPEFTGVENVYFNGTLMGYSREEMDSRLDSILAFADIGEFVQQPVKTYSSGMFVRLAFAVAINVDPDILIVDEAMSVGDVKFQRKCFYKIEQFRSQGKTIIYVSHDANSVNNLCDQAILLDNGKLILFTEPKAVTQLYQQIIFNENVDTPAVQPDENCDLCNADNLDNNNSGSQDESVLARLIMRSNAIKDNNIRLQNKAVQELRHGNLKAEILDFGITDKENRRTNIVVSGAQCNIFFKILLYEDLADPFFSVIIRDVQGLNLFYTNTNILKTKIGKLGKNKLVNISSKINMCLAPRDYFMSFVVNDNTNNEYCDRRVDALHFTVVSEVKNGGGFVNMNPNMECIELWQYSKA